jgi:hypothetical protein
VRVSPIQCHETVLHCPAEASTEMPLSASLHLYI